MEMPGFLAGVLRTMLCEVGDSSRQLRRHWEEFPLRTGYQILGLSVCMLGCEAVIMFGMGFQPAWAASVGFPLGISKHVVFAVWACAMLTVMMVTAGAGVLAVACSHLQQMLRLKYIGWGGFAFLFVVWIVVATFVCSQPYPSFYASIVHDWP